MTPAVLDLDARVVLWDALVAIDEGKPTLARTCLEALSERELDRLLVLVGRAVGMVAEVREERDHVQPLRVV